MRDIIEQSLGWAVIVGIVLAVFLGRKRGQESRAAAIAQAHATGFAEGGRAAAAAHAQQSVMVAVDASRRDHARGVEEDHACADPWLCVVCAPRLYRLAERQRASLPAGHDDDDNGSDHDDGAAVHDGRGYFFDRTDTLAVPIGRRGEGERRGRDHDSRPGRVHLHEPETD